MAQPAFPTLTRDKVDLLFVVDNAMGPKTGIVAREISRMGAVIESAVRSSATASFHIGVITTDLGTLSYRGTFACRPGGDNGRLQRLGAGAPADCVAPQNRPFMSIDRRTSTDNINGLDQLTKTLSCMTAVGVDGCPYKQPLESLRVALLSPDNAAFFRDDALLVIALLTDVDDCSTDDVLLYSFPTSYEPDGMGARSPFRCARYGITVQGPSGRTLLPFGPTNGEAADPRPATKADGGRLFELARYVDLLTKPRSEGGVKDNPNDILIGLIAAPPTPVEVVLDTRSQLAPCPPIGDSCVPSLVPSCVSSRGTDTGEPAVRLHALATNLPDERRATVDLCSLQYAPFADELMRKVLARLTP